MSNRPLPPCRPPRIEDADRLRDLLEAYRTINEELSLTAVLARIVRAACELVGASYAAVRVVAPDGSVERFVQHGADETPHRYAFLDLPIPARGAARSELHLGRRAPDTFSADDERLVTAFAAAAGTAIDNARRYDEARRSRDWLNASGDIARALLADADDAILFEMVSRALSVSEADYAALILPTDDDQLRVAVATGLSADHHHGQVFDPAGSTLGKAILAAEPIRTHDMTLWASADYDNPFDFGPAMIAPLVDAQGSRGALIMVRTADRPPYTHHDVELASTFAVQVAIALELNDARADTEWVNTLEHRNELGQNVSDTVMQRLFATGVGLQSLAEQLDDPAATARLRRYIGELDETIDQIRTRVFGPSEAAVSLPRRRHRFPHVTRSAAGAARRGGTAPPSRTPRALRRDDVEVRDR